MGKCEDCKCGKGITIDNTYGHPIFYLMIQKMAKLHANKNRDYGNGNPLGNFMTAEDLGVDPFMGVLIRMSDKWTRICSLVNQGTNYVKDESIEDTLLDLANYCLLSLVIKREVDKKKPYMEDPDHVQIGHKAEGQVAGAFVKPTDTATNDEYITRIKSFTCLTCTMFAGDPNYEDHQCYHCIFNGRDRGSIDYYVDQRQVAALAGKGVVGMPEEEKIECVGGEFCACTPCVRERNERC
jgi:hypothetical protein